MPNGAPTVQSSTDLSAVACQALAPSAVEIQNILEASLRPFVRQTQRRVTFFHYGYRTRRYPNGAPEGVYDDSVAVPAEGSPNDFSGPISTQSRALAERYFRTKASGHFGTISQSQELGLGLYTATEPLSSLGYSADEAPVMIAVTVPPGVGYLDERSVHRAIPLSEERAQKLWCYRKNQCLTSECRQRLDQQVEALRQRKAWPTLDPKDFLSETSAQRFLRQAYSNLGIRFLASSYGRYLYPECRLNPSAEFMTMAVFTDPELASHVQVDALVPNMEPNPTPQRLAVYREALQYFDAFDFSQASGADNGLDPDSPRDQRSVEFFWRYYNAWAPIVHGLPPGTDLREYQRQTSQRLRSQRHERVTSQLFGCSSDPKYRDEAFPPARVTP